MPIFKKLRAVLAIVAIVLSSIAVSSVSANEFPDVRGTWFGTYKVAFPHGHPEFPDQSVATSMELEVYKQEGHRIWVINRWRRNNSDPWVVEHGTGSFDLDEQDELVIAEKKLSPEVPGINTGMFIGEYDQGVLSLNYIGTGAGITFSVKLQKSSN